jgi:hypothetical protein
VLKLNSNHYGLEVKTQISPGFQVAPGQSSSCSVPLSKMTNLGQTAPTGPIVLVETGIKCSLDLFFFQVPMLLQVGLLNAVSGLESEQQMFESMDPDKQLQVSVANMNVGLNNAGIVTERLKDNGIHFLKVGKNQFDQDCLYFFMQTEHQNEFGAVEMQISAIGQCQLTIRASVQHLLPLMSQALSFVLSANSP